MEIQSLLQRENDRLKDYIVRSCSDLTGNILDLRHLGGFETYALG